MFDARANIAHQVADEVRGYFQDLVFSAVVPRNVRLAECPSFGKPILLYDIKSKGCESYLALGNEIHAARADARPTAGRLMTGALTWPHRARTRRRAARSARSAEGSPR